VKFKKISVVAVVLLAFLCFAGAGTSFAEGLRESETGRKETWVSSLHVRGLNPDIKLVLFPGTTMMSSYTLHFKGARPGDTINITNPGNCLVGDADTIEFDDEKKAMVTMLPRNSNSEVFFMSGLFRTRGIYVPFSVAWKSWGREVKYVTGVDLFKD